MEAIKQFLTTYVTPWLAGTLTRSALYLLGSYGITEGDVLPVISGIISILLAFILSFVSKKKALDATPPKK